MPPTTIYQPPTSVCGPCRVRTGDLYIANVALWPTELTAHDLFNKVLIIFTKVKNRLFKPVS